MPRPPSGPLTAPVSPATDDSVENNLRRAYVRFAPASQGDRFDELLARLAARLHKPPPHPPA